MKKDNKGLSSRLVTVLTIVTIVAACFLVGLLIGRIAVTVNNTDPDCFTITDGVLTAYEGEDRTVKIPEGVVVVGERVFIGHTEIEKIIMPSTLTTLKNGAFYGCTALSEVVFSESLNFIGDAVFGECDALTAFELPASVQYIHSEAFYDSPGLSSIEVAEGNPNYMTQDGVLYSADGKTLITYPVGRTAESFTVPADVEVIAVGAFALNQSLAGIDLANVREIGERAFQNCPALTAVTLPESVTTLYQEAFSGCTALAELTIAEGVQIFGQSAFSGCTALTAVSFPESTEEIGRSCFSGCTALETADIPASLVGIYETAFDGCPNLTIRSEAGAPAEAFAEEYGIAFEAK